MHPTPRVLIAGSVMLLGGLALGSSWVATGLSRDALVREIQLAERLAANERAAEVDAMLANVHGLLDTMVLRPSFLRSFVRQEASALEADLSSALGQRGLVGATVTDADGVSLADVGASSTSSGILELRTEIGGGGDLRTRFELDALIPRVVAPLHGFDGTVSLMHQDGTVLASSLGAGERQQDGAPEVKRVLESGGLIEYRSPVVGEERIAAVTPLQEQPWALVVSAPVDGAHRSAVALVRRLSVVLGLTATIAAVIVSVLILGIGRSGRRAEHRRLEAEAEATTDTLTGLANRRRLQQAVAAYADAAQDVTMVLVDVDNFKVLNDELGHVAGDEALQLVATALTGSVRSDDLVVRWGGDEFAVLLAETATAVTTVGRIRAAVHAVEVPGFGPLRCSVGVARGPADLTALLREADVSLYTDKREAAAAC